MKTDHTTCPVRVRVQLDDPNEPLEMIAFTLARYKFACKWLRETDRVLEVGCGEGFGCNFFSQHVQAVAGMDSDPDVIARCRQRYTRENLHFFVDDIVRPKVTPQPNYDAVVAFEMIEHVGEADGRQMVAHCAAFLNAGGLLMLSTPRARPDRSVSRRVHHVFEYDYFTLLNVLTPHFRRVMVFCQNDEYIYAGHPSTAWNYIALAFR